MIVSVSTLNSFKEFFHATTFASQLFSPASVCVSVSILNSTTGQLFYPPTNGLPKTEGRRGVITALFDWQCIINEICVNRIMISGCNHVKMMMMMIYFLYSATSNYALSALQLLKHELIYRLFFTHTNIHKAAIEGASIISFTPNFHTK